MYTEIACVMDRSGSMFPIANDAIGGYNHFVIEQKAIPTKTNLSLYLFDDKYETIFESIPIQDAPTLTTQTYIPRGTTALFDAVANTITNLGKKLAEKQENERPEKVIVVIITDGQENSSKEYTNITQIKSMIEHQTTKYNWEFLYLSADPNAFADATAIGIHANNFTGYTHTSIGTAGAFSAASNVVAKYRAGSSRDDVSLREEYKKNDK